MSQSWESIPSPGTGPLPSRRGGFFRRLLAYLIDGIVLGIITEVLIVALGRRGGAALEFVVYLAYFTILIGGQRGQTLGGMVTGLRVASVTDGGSIGYGRALVRALVAIVSEAVIFIGYLWMLWDRDKQTWHDKAAQAVVVPVR